MKYYIQVLGPKVNHDIDTNTKITFRFEED